MLDIAARHSMRLGYRWSPTKCAVLNAPPTRPFSLYSEELPCVDEFVYLGLPFLKAGLSTDALLRRRTSGTLLAMATLQAIGARPSGFSALLSSRLYRQFIRPKFEYGLAISRLTAPNSKALEQLQDRCLRMITGGHRTSSMTVFRHLCDLPSMKDRALTLGMKFCTRLEYLPDDCLLILLLPILSPYGRLSFLKKNPLYVSLPSPTPLQLKPFVLEHRHKQLQIHRTHQKKRLLKGCRPTIGIDPIMYLPATRLERSRLIRWRMGWLPGKPRPCPCGTDHTSRRHLAQCPMLPRHLWEALPISPEDNHPLDFAISQIPCSLAEPPPYWPALLSLLYRIDQLCLAEGNLALEPEPGSSWTAPLPLPARSPSPPL